ncbi:MAG: hypothetical protein ACXITR_00770 [Cyanobacterium sp.]
MKITQQTATKLILEATKYSFLKRAFFFLFASPFFLVGIFIIVDLGKVNTLECQKSLSREISCSLNRRNLLGEEVITIEKGSLDKAELGVNSSDDSDTYRVNLITKEGIVPLTEVYSSGIKEKRDNTNQINYFINNSSDINLQIIQDDRWFAYPVGSVFVLSGAGLMAVSLLFFTQVKCTFDKGIQRFYLIEKNVLKTHEKEYKMWEIKSAELVEHKDSKGRKSYNVDLVFKNMSRIKIDIDGGLSGCQEFVNTFNNFLGLT